jgi:hypothetical protein
VRRIADYPRRTMKEKFTFHRDRAKGAIKKGEKLSERDLAMQSIGYVKHAEQSYDAYLYKNNKPKYNERKAAKKAYREAKQAEKKK